jgi:hypothetical protein
MKMNEYIFLYNIRIYNSQTSGRSCLRSSPFLCPQILLSFLSRPTSLSYYAMAFCASMSLQINHATAYASIPSSTFFQTNHFASHPVVPPSASFLINCYILYLSVIPSMPSPINHSTPYTSDFPSTSFPLIPFTQYHFLLPSASCPINYTTFTLWFLLLPTQLIILAHIIPCFLPHSTQLPRLPSTSFSVNHSAPYPSVLSFTSPSLRSKYFCHWKPYNKFSWPTVGKYTSKH